MIDLVKYRADKHISQRDCANAIRPVHKQFSKIQVCMAERPEYGLCLRDTAERALTIKYGELAETRKADRHKHPSRVTCRMSKREIKAFAAALKKYGHTAQAMIYQMIDLWMEQNAAEAWHNAKKVARTDSSRTDNKHKKTYIQYTTTAPDVKEEL